MTVKKLRVGSRLVPERKGSGIILHKIDKHALGYYSVNIKVKDVVLKLEINMGAATPDF